MVMLTNHKKIIISTWYFDAAIASCSYWRIVMFAWSDQVNVHVWSVSSQLAVWMFSADTLRPMEVYYYINYCSLLFLLDIYSIILNLWTWHVSNGHVHPYIHASRRVNKNEERKLNCCPPPSRNDNHVRHRIKTRRRRSSRLVGQTGNDTNGGGKEDSPVVRLFYTVRSH